MAPLRVPGLVELDVIPFEFLKPDFQCIEAARLPSEDPGLESGKQKLTFDLQRCDFLVRRLALGSRLTRKLGGEPRLAQVFTHRADPRRGLRRGLYRLVCLDRALDTRSRFR